MAFLLEAQDSPGASHTRIDNHHVDGTPGEVPERSVQCEGSLGDVVSGVVVGKINDPDTGIDGKDDAFHHAHIFIVQAKVGEKGNDTRWVNHRINSGLLRLMAMLFMQHTI
jgi:hypothetical protein